MNKRQNENARRQAAQEVLARGRARERRRAVIIWSVAGAVIAAIAVAVALVIGGTVAQQDAAREAAARPIEGVQTYPDLSRNHVPNATFAQEPGVGGDHSPQWTTCAVYTAPVEEARAVHSLEHGAVWIADRPDLPADQVQRLTSLVQGKPYVLLSPYPGLDAPVKATAWGLQLATEDASDSRLAAFVAKYANGPQTPEKGASCTGGVNG